MNDILTIIGTITSVVSIPMAIYFYLKEREQSFEKTKREIVKTLSYQIGDRRQLTYFEINTVINTSIRKAKIKRHKITANHIIEDMVSETMSNPLLDKESKDKILKELKDMYKNGEYTIQLNNVVKDIKDGDKSWEEIKDELENVMVKPIDVSYKVDWKISEFYIQIVITMVGALLVAFISASSQLEIIDKIYDFVYPKGFKFSDALNLGVIGAGIALIVSYIVQYVRFFYHK